MIEMLVVCLILGVVLTGITTVFVSGSHAELNLNNRFQAQQAARLALDAMRTDAHGACAANGPSSGTQARARLRADVGRPDDVRRRRLLRLVSEGGLVRAHEPDRPRTQYALYRSTATDSTCTTANGKLEADNLTSSNVFSTGTTITGRAAPDLHGHHHGQPQDGHRPACPTRSPRRSRSGTRSTDDGRRDVLLDERLARSARAGICPYLARLGNPTNASCYPAAIK